MPPEEYDFSETMIRELGEVSRRRTHYRVEDGHRIEFAAGEAVAVNCLTLGVAVRLQISNTEERPAFGRTYSADDGWSAGSGCVGHRVYRDSKQRLCRCPTPMIPHTAGYITLTIVNATSVTSVASESVLTT